MMIGVPKEIKPQEGRVALLPNLVSDLVRDGFGVNVQSGAGLLSGATNDDYAAAGATVMNSMEAVYAESGLIFKVKEFLEPEYPLLREDHILFTNIHPAATPQQVDVLLERGLVAFAAEDTHEFGSPNCALAGEVGAFEGIRLCFAQHGGSGRHFLPHFGSQPIKAAVIGLGNVGRGALRVLLSLGVEVVGFDISDGIRYRTEQDWDATNFSTADIGDFVHRTSEFDLIVNCVLWPKHRDDHLISRAQLKQLKPTAVITDISCDAGGAVETCRPTTWQEPTYREEGITHFCVDNIPGSVPVAASAGYGKALVPHIRNILANGWREAARSNAWLRRGLVCAEGTLTHAETARLQNRERLDPEAYLAE
ncbi:alanine dehydrogenase [Aestuariispira insulae]|uniref:Saccharopine dehydrogenase [NAD(+), L-lysine-forming] n=1 Tax=Aestuariispira insulae TaxID=1461337 RepID=A0A3D9HND0_9PROT|nr:NAD(P)-dependent oxidoreductase [Aestuariispira insulae]RED50994.1 alanine dehydrogenase [Aestuariispira insulae]